ncbi:serine--tRNA ligase [Paenibacillus sp. 1011MAR3C5]|uniref:serine--tRNA ligase n=1 Tax=Paenibacillus sp. 1011MAR3C5 TaxID=1675787 RepID=UPI000E6BE825|nr:serine--tRNA ligase [Paenibacillus sp. 1011MAR3C5]RJE86056.1 serine--tRNA ligase [Paenibacillus sp. 1011MAR3C5]
MLDMKWVREHAEEVRVTVGHKGIHLSVDELLARDEERRRLKRDTDMLRERRNRLSSEVGRLMQEQRREEAEAIRAETKTVNAKLAELETELRAAEERFGALYELVPNVVSPDTPIGRSDEDNVELKRVGEVPVFPFEPKDHIELGELHGLIDVPRGVKTGGSRHYYLRGAGAQLHRAVQQLALDLLLERDFLLLEVPLMVKEEAMNHTGYFPLGRDQAYKLDEVDGYLAGTSEVPLIMYYAGEVVEAETPIRLAAASMCFRSEVGSAGRDVRGLYRVHQFAKVEQVVICKSDPAVSEAILQEITANAELLLQKLELPYRQMAVCTGDMSQKTYKQYDLETWMPSRGAYGETHSSSNLRDFQARRANIRYRDEEGALRYCHTLNNTAVASPRILIPLLENHQQEDGSVYIPAALRPYMNGLTELRPPCGPQEEEA